MKQFLQYVSRLELFLSKVCQPEKAKKDPKQNVVWYSLNWLLV